MKTILAQNDCVSMWFRQSWIMGLALGLASCAVKHQPSHALKPLTLPRRVSPSTNPWPANTTGEAAPARPFLVPEVPSTNIVSDPWISWPLWCRDHGLPKPAPAVQNGRQTFTVPSSRGALTLTMGSHLAEWNQLHLWLGFSPKLIEDTPFIHIMDGAKSLQPLCENPRWLKANAVIVLDPGHGGKDPGAKSIIAPVIEKDLTLDWARRVGKHLVTQGFEVVLTRTNDVELSLPQRVAIADACAADLFISLHFNSAFPSLEPAGLETYCLTPVGMPSSITRNYADDWTARSQNNRFDTQNWQSAVALHRALIQTVVMPDRAVRRARFMGVLREQNRPAILLEGGYLSNPNEARRIAEADYRELLSIAVARGIMELVASPVNQTVNTHD